MSAAITALARELLEMQLGSYEDAMVLAEDAPAEIREELELELDRLAFGD